MPREIPIRQEKVKLCLDCGRVTASMTVDVDEARRVLNQWGSDALIARLGKDNRGA